MFIIKATRCLIMYFCGITFNRNYLLDLKMEFTRCWTSIILCINVWLCCPHMGYIKVILSCIWLRCLVLAYSKELRHREIFFKYELLDLRELMLNIRPLFNPDDVLSNNWVKLPNSHILWSIFSSFLFLRVQSVKYSWNLLQTIEMIYGAYNLSIGYNIISNEILLQSLNIYILAIRGPSIDYINKFKGLHHRTCFFLLRCLSWIQ